ncbi:MAG: glycosyltransferase [Acidobacteriota bacterium]|nr:glycosyltransferase [Acidobacteriota bacterium]
MITGEDFSIAGTLDSLRRQTYEDWESILVNDGSTDDTHEQVKPYLSDPRFTYLKQENQGIAAARNTGISAARGEWICLLDHDDRWMTTKLERQLDFARAHNFDIVATEAVVVKGTHRTLHRHYFREHLLARVEQSLNDPSIDVFELLIEADFLCASSVMIRKSLFDRLGLLDVSAAPCDDYEMWLRCMPDARIGYLSAPLIEYVLHERNFSKNVPMMYERTIQLLFKTREKFLQDERRRRQFDDSLLRLYQLLFRELLKEKRYRPVLAHALLLCALRQGGHRLLFKSLSLRQLLAATQ